MKKFLPVILLILLFGTQAESKKKNQGGNALIAFTTESHDFGIIQNDNEPVSTEFEFVNQGNVPLVIYSATADCGCTRPEYPKNPVAPGKKGKIKVNFLPKGYMGSFTKNVKVKSNGSKKVKVLKITGVINPNETNK